VRPSGSGAVFAIPRAHHCVHASAVVLPFAWSVETVPIYGSEQSKKSRCPSRPIQLEQT
jgi:hypothetical protein